MNRLHERIKSVESEASECIFRRFYGYTPEKERRGIMSKKKEKRIDLNNLEPGEKLKYEVAEELGLLDRVLSDGWKSLTSKETGRIGGIVTRKRRQAGQKQ